MLKTILSWFRRPEPEPAPITYARQVLNTLDWWLIGFGAPGTAAVMNPRIAETAMRFYEEQHSVRWASAHFANILVGDLVLAYPEEVRREVVQHIADPEVNQQLVSIKSSDVVMTADLLYGFATDDAALNAAMRSKMHAQVLERIAAPTLSPRAHALFAAVRHLWERATVAVQLDPDDKDLRYHAGRLINEVLYALRGDDAPTRERRHMDALIEGGLQPEPTAAQGDTA